MSNTNTKPQTDKPFFRTAREVGDYLGGIHERTVRRMMRRHVIPFCKLGGCLLVRRADLDAAIDSMTFPAYAAPSPRRRGRMAK